MIYISNPQLKPNVILMIQKMIDERTGYFLDYGHLINNYWIIEVPIESWEDDDKKLIYMINNLNNLLKIPLSIRTTVLFPFSYISLNYFWFRIIPNNLSLKENIVQYHIISKESIGNYLNFDDNNINVKLGDYHIYMYSPIYKFNFFINKINNKKIDLENFGTDQITYINPNIKNFFNN